MKILISLLLLSLSLLAITTHITTDVDASGTVSETTNSYDANGNPSSTQLSPNGYSALKAPLQNIFETTEWNLLLSEFEITLDVGNCGIMPGVKAKMIEPIGYYEESNRAMYFPFADIAIESNVLKTNSQYTESTASAYLRTKVTHSHFVYAPIFGLIFKKELPFFCFHPGPVAVYYMSEFDPSYKQDILGMQMIPQMIAMFSPTTLLLTVVDCMSTELVQLTYNNKDNYSLSGYEDDIRMGLTDEGESIGRDNAGVSPDGSESTMKKFKSGSRHYLDSIRDSIYFVNGCNGFNPVGGYKEGNRPITDAHLGWAGNKSLLMTASALSQFPLLRKTTELSFISQPSTISGIPNTMCEPKNFALAYPSDNMVQLAGYPTTQSAREEGSSINADTAANSVGAQGTAHMVWKRRHYYAFAYTCK